MDQLFITFMVLKHSPDHKYLLFLLVLCGNKDYPGVGLYVALGELVSIEYLLEIIHSQRGYVVFAIESHCLCLMI